MQNLAIIGGGPAGLATALEGIKKGFNVTLFEKCEIGENIHCAEGLFDTLNMIGEPKQGVKYKVDKILFQLESEYRFECGDTIPIWMLDKAEWLRGMKEEAAGAGVRIIENCVVNSESFHKLIKQYDWVIDCSGAPSVTSKAYRFYKYYLKHSYIAVQYILKGDFSALYKNFKLGFEKHYKGYYWIFPKSETEANVGLGLFRYDKRNLWKELDRMLKKENLSTYQVIRKVGGICPCRTLGKLRYGNVLLAGNAAGLASPLHGGGIDTAMLSGRIAVESIASGRTRKYEKQLNTVLSKKLKSDKKLCNLLMLLSYSHLEKIIRTLCNEGISLGKAGFFNGELFYKKRFILYRKLIQKLFNKVIHSIERYR